MKLFSALSLLLILVPATLVAQPRTTEPRSLALAVRSAAALVESGSYGRALAELEPAIDSAHAQEPLADALYLQSEANFMLARYARARSACERFVAYAPGDSRRNHVLFTCGVAAYQDGDTNAAQEAFLRVDTITGTIDPYYWLARISAERNRLDAAEAYARRSAATPDSAASPYRTDAVYLLAWIAEGRDRLDSAAQMYRWIIDGPANDRVLDARLRLGVIDARRGNHESAVRLLNSLTPRTTRQREEQLFYLSEMSAALGRHDEALRYATEFVREFPTSPRLRPARYTIGWAQLNMGRYDEAITTFRTLENGIDSIAAAAAYQIGAIQLRRNDTAGAVRSFQSLLARLPYESFSDNAYFQLGRYFYRRAMYDSARHFLLIAARQFPESEIRSESYYLLGESYAALGDAGNAQFAFARTRRTGATGEPAERALYREGIMLYKVGRFRSAIDRFREYVSEHAKGADIADATFWLGEALYQDRTYDEAERYYNAYVEKHASGVRLEQALYGLAWSRFQQKEFKGAALAFDDFVKNHKESPLAVEATIRLADCYRLMGQFDKAVQTYESIGGVSGKGARDEEARFRLADVFLQMGQTERAVATFRKLIADYPNSPLRDAYAFNIGSIYREKEMDSLAIEELKPFGSRYPNSQLLPQATFTIGDAYYNMEAFDSALVYYRLVLDRYPNSVIVPEALEAVRFTLNALDRGGEAVAIIDSFQVRNPERIPADSLNYRKALIVLEAGSFADAIVRFQRIVDEFPKSPLAPEALVGIGRAYEYLGRRDSALLIYNRVVELHGAAPAAERARIEAAGLHLRAQEWSAASDGYSGFVAAYPTSERINEARFGLAAARLRLKDTAAALEQLERVLATDTSSSEEDLFLDRSRIMFARVTALRGGSERALELLAAVVSRRLDDIAAEALLLRGELLYRLKDYAGGLAELRRLMTDFSTFPEFAEPGTLLAGAIHEQLTNYVAARDLYTQLQATAESPAIRAEAEARLKKLKK